MDQPLTRRRVGKLFGAALAAGSAAGAAPEICSLSAVEMARRIRSKQLSARDALSAHLKQIERVNPKVNAIVTLVADQAMEHARQADESLVHGKPRGRACRH